MGLLPKIYYKIGYKNFNCVKMKKILQFMQQQTNNLGEKVLGKENVS